MTAAVRVDPDSESFLKTLETAGVIAALLSVATFLAGGLLGIVTMAATETNEFGRPSHPTLGIGAAITLLSLVVGMLAAMMSWLALSYARPRLGVIANFRHEQAHRTALDEYRRAENARDRRSD